MTARADPQAHALARNSFADVRHQAHYHACQHDSAPQDLVVPELVGIPEPGDQGGNGCGAALLDERCQRGPETRQGSQQRQTADAEADRAGNEEQAHLPLQPLADREGPYPHHDERDQQSQKVGPDEADQPNGPTGGYRRDAEQDRVEKGADHGAVAGPGLLRR